MLFQTLEFAWLMAAVIAGLVLVRAHALRLALILLASWVFYASWNPAFLTLLLYCTVNDWALGLAIGRAQTAARKHLWLIVSLVTNLGVLAIFTSHAFGVSALHLVALGVVTLGVALVIAG